MPNFLVGPAQTYTTIQAALDAVIALGNLSGLGDHNIIIDNGFVHDGALSFTGMQAQSTGRVNITTAGRFTLIMTSALLPTQYVTIEKFDIYPKAGFTGDRLLRFPSPGCIGRDFKATNPNNITGLWGVSSDYAFGLIEDALIVGFSTGLRDVQTVRRVTIHNNTWRGMVTCNIVTDCVVTNSVVDFSSITTPNYCASSDSTATGTGAITNIVAADEFTSPTTGDFTLKTGSQLYFAGSTGNNIGWDQAVPAGAYITLDGVYAPSNPIGITFNNFDGIPDFVNLSAGNISMNPAVYTVEGNHFFNLPALPDSGDSAQGLPFGELITVTATDPGP